jgi:hypothetical protein
VGPRSVATVVLAKNSPPDCFLNARTVQQEIIIRIILWIIHLSFYSSQLSDCGARRDDIKKKFSKQFKFTGKPSESIVPRAFLFTAFFYYNFFCYQSGYSGDASLLAHNLKATSDKVKFTFYLLIFFTFSRL